LGYKAGVNLAADYTPEFDALKERLLELAQIIEIVANIAQNIFFNYFNSMAETEVDFPLLQPGTDAPSAAIRALANPVHRLGAQVAKAAG
jgi:hypothetical protein